MVEEVGQHSICLALTHQTDVTFNFNFKKKKKATTNPEDGMQ